MDAEPTTTAPSGIADLKQGVRVDMTIRISRFNLPPVQSALVVGKRAGIGSRAIGKALDEMMPKQFERFDVEHPLIEAVLVRSAHLRRVPSDKLIPVIVRHAESVMADVDMLHFDIAIELLINERIEL